MNTPDHPRYVLRGLEAGVTLHFVTLAGRHLPCTVTRVVVPDAGVVDLKSTSTSEEFTGIDPYVLHGSNRNLVGTWHWPEII